MISRAQHLTRRASHFYLGARGKKRFQGLYAKKENQEEKINLLAPFEYQRGKRGASTRRKT